VVALGVAVGEQSKLASKVPKNRFQLPWEVVVLELDHVLNGPAIALDPTN
jgi:hypothetical protein